MVMLLVNICSVVGVGFCALRILGNFSTCQRLNTCSTNSLWVLPGCGSYSPRSSKVANTDPLNVLHQYLHFYHGDIHADTFVPQHSDRKEDEDSATSILQCRPVIYSHPNFLARPSIPCRACMSALTLLPKCMPCFDFIFSRASRQLRGSLSRIFGKQGERALAQHPNRETQLCGSSGSPFCHQLIHLYIHWRRGSTS
ncbi:hypothetical protein BKA61DRAFT_79083 [Leptodontidium sp. MPI-SDFR-AT-0119]|nr:hypothetical protein BKA61DRAFT_79083 [Leptodontidium sp. MPI-SDFR-AT-0119]